MSLDNLTKGERFIFEWQYGMSGGFMRALARVITLADDINLARLAKGFPEEVKACKKFFYEEDWWERVVEKGMNERKDIKDNFTSQQNALHAWRKYIDKRWQKIYRINPEEARKIWEEYTRVVNPPIGLVDRNKGGKLWKERLAKAWSGFISRFVTIFLFF